eukprot:GHVS01050127.1.p1 GENE.GHVS01050127.1~~GHVS01050127.1.p1  ORF type:complete len:262 (+),score=53.76 GHVS01050127.1:840-1625(+)
MCEEQLAEFEQMCERRRGGEPVQLVVGEWDFCGHTFKMCAGVFIPRPETEEMVDIIISRLRASSLTTQPLRILEVGVGTGAVALSLLKALPHAQCVGIDLNPKAVQTAIDNSHSISTAGGGGESVAVGNRYFCYLSKIQNLVLSDLPAQFTGGFDLLVSNPPYIPTAQLSSLQTEVKHFEPADALDGGPDGLDTVHAILRRSAQLVRVGGQIWLEVHESHPRELARLYRKADVQFEEQLEDINGKERFVLFSYRPNVLRKH